MFLPENFGFVLFEFVESDFEQQVFGYLLFDVQHFELLAAVQKFVDFVELADFEFRN